MKKFVKILVLILFSICLGAGICTYDFFGSAGWFCAIICFVQSECQNLDVQQ